MRMCLYHNTRIINVIHEMFFTGGVSSFANRFYSEFPVHQGNDERELHEIPIVMVALVTTAVGVAYGH